MMLLPQLLCLLGLALGTMHAAPLAKEVELEQGSCPMSWYSFSGRCYKYVGAAMFWTQAEVNCLNQGANLVSVRSAEENDFVQTLVRNQTLVETSFAPSFDTWVGLNALGTEGVWKWSDGTQLDYSAWQEGQPDGDSSMGKYCGVISGGTWWDQKCHNAVPSSVCAFALE